MQWFIASTEGRLRGIMGAELYRVDGVPRVMSCGSRIVESNVGSFFYPLSACPLKMAWVFEWVIGGVEM